VMRTFLNMGRAKQLSKFWWGGFRFHSALFNIYS
jgi:hypothetical protein